MDLFGQNIMDFPDESATLFLGRLPRVSESDYVSDLGINKRNEIDLLEINKKLTDWGLSMEDSGVIDDSLVYCTSEDSNDSAYTDQSVKSEEEQKSTDLLQEEISYFCDSVTFEEVVTEENVVEDEQCQEVFTEEVINTDTDEVIELSGLADKSFEDDVMNAEVVCEDISSSASHEVMMDDSVTCFSEDLIDSVENNSYDLLGNIFVGNSQTETEAQSVEIADSVFVRTERCQSINHEEVTSTEISSQIDSSLIVPDLTNFVPSSHDDLHQSLESPCDSGIGLLDDYPETQLSFENLLPTENEFLISENSNSSELLEETSESDERHLDVFSDIDINAILHAKNKSEELNTNSSNMIGGAECDFIEELKGIKSTDDSILSEISSADTDMILDGSFSSLKSDAAGISCDLDQFDFNLSQDYEKLENDIKNLTDEVNLNNDSGSSEDFWSEIFSEADPSNSTEYDDLLDSILSSAENLDPEYFNSLTNNEFDIDSVDPTCLKKANIESEKEKTPSTEDIKEEIKIELDIKEEIVEAEEDTRPRFDETSHFYTDHDYTIPRTSSLFLTPPHSSEEESDEDSTELPYTVKYKNKNSLLKSMKSMKYTNIHNHLVKNTPVKGKSQIIKFHHKKDLKFVINLPVKRDNKSNARSILKNKILQNKARELKDRSSSKLSPTKQMMRGSRDQIDKQKSAKELVREILEKRSLAQDIQEKREFVKTMKKRLREETQKDTSSGPKAKYRCIQDIRSKPDDKKYRKFEEERELHNSMERQRRIELKDAYDHLKAIIPNISNVDKVSKLMILNTASDYCKSMEAKIGRLELIEQRESDKRRLLLEQLNMLKLQM